METKTKKEAVAQGANAVNEKISNVAKNAPAEKDNVREIGKNLPVVVPNPAIELAKTIKTVTELHTKIRHLDRLETYTDELEKFKVKKQEENLDDKSAYYAGCKMELRDDDNRTFAIKHPVIVKEVIDFVLGRLSARRAELEAEIKLPVKAA